MVYNTSSRREARWPDLYAVKRGILGRKKTISIDAKVNYSEFKRLHEQCANFARYSNKVFVATTPGLVAEAGMQDPEAQAVAYGEQAFMRLVRPFGAYLIDTTSKEIWKVLDASESEDLVKEEQDRRLRILGYKPQ